MLNVSCGFFQLCNATQVTGCKLRFVKAAEPSGKLHFVKAADCAKFIKSPSLNWYFRERLERLANYNVLVTC